MRAIGLMSGTSLDGIDAALVDIEPRGERLEVRSVRFETVPFARDFRARLLAALPPHDAPPALASELDRELGKLFADAALRVAAGEAIDFVASHGLTLFHRGEACETLQIGDPYRVRDVLQASVVFDFRRADCAAGGNGAPLVPYVDGLLFASSGEDVVALNLGGIANVTLLPRGAAVAGARAWDTGPASMLIDAFVRQRTGGAEQFDRDGAYALRGAPNAGIVAELTASEARYFAQAPPKSTGRERFGERFYAAHAARFDGVSLEDGCATLVAFTVDAICDSLAAFAPRGVRVVASGGGTHNAALMRSLRERLAVRACTLASSSDYGIDPDAKEAIAFAILAFETLRGRPSNVPSATGAMRPAVLGAIAPHSLAALLAKIEGAAPAKGSA